MIRSLALTLALSWATAMAATPGLDEPPAAQSARPIVVPAMTEQRLANGLIVASSSRSDLPLVSISLLARVGPEQDPPDRAGLAAITATLLTKGLKRGATALSASALAQQAEALGSTLDSSSGWRSSGLGMTVTTFHLPAALALMAQALRQPSLDGDELERARALALDSLRVALGDPAEVASQVMRRAYWGASPYGASPTAASLARISRADVQRFHARAYRPEQTVLVLVGDVSAETALALAGKLLGDWKPAAAPAADLPALPTANSALPALPTANSALPALPSANSALPALVRIDMPGSGQTAMVVTAPFVGSAAPDRRIGQVANAVLGGGYSARLNQKVRIEGGKSYGAFSQVESQPEAGALVALTQTQHATAAEVLAILRREIIRLAEAPPSGDELAARSANLVGGFARRLGSNGGVAALMLGQYAQGRPLQELQRYAAEVAAVTPAQVQAFARTHWAADALRAVVSGDLSAAGAALDEPGALSLKLPELDLERPGLIGPK